MKKGLGIVIKYVRAAGVSLFVIILISALSMTGLTLSYGRIKKETEKYDKLRSSALTGWLYGTKIKPPSDLEEKIRGVNGVEDVIRRPDTVKFKVSDRTDETYTMKLYSKEHYDNANLIMKGGGFDYESDAAECIIAAEQFKNYRVGDVFSAEISLGGKKSVKVDFTVSGVIEFPQSVLSMSGGGSSIDASLLYEDAPCIIIKDQSTLRDMISAGITKSYMETMFIKLDNSLTENEQNNVYEELSKYLTYQSVSEILDNTKAEINTALSNFLPVIIFCVLYSVITLVSMEILISYKTADELSVYRCLGMSRARLFVTVCITETAVIIISFLLSYLLTRLVFLVPDISSGMIFSPGLLIPALILGVSEIAVSNLTVVLTNSRKSIRSTYERI